MNLLHHDHVGTFHKTLSETNSTAAFIFNSGHLWPLCKFWVTRVTGVSRGLIGGQLGNQVQSIGQQPVPRS
jgi:hypothetical protein